MGDSVGIQISTYLQDLLQGDGDTKILKMPLGMGKDPKPSIHVTSPLSNDGKYGAIAGWRLLECCNVIHSTGHQQIIIEDGTKKL